MQLLHENWINNVKDAKKKQEILVESSLQTSLFHIKSFDPFLIQKVITAALMFWNSARNKSWQVIQMIQCVFTEPEIFQLQ